MATPDNKSMATPVNKSTRLLVGAVVGGIRRNYGIMELWNYGKGKSAHGSWLMAHSPITLSTLSTFYTL